MKPEQLPDVARDVPRVVIAEHVIDKMVHGALQYPDPETGEAMVGLVVPQVGRLEPDIYVLDTISPGQHAVREWGMFEQGDDWQGDVFHWLYVNWEAIRTLRRSSYGSALAAKWDVPLRHVGDWHKQPGMMVAPSGGDAATARRMIADAETPIEHIVAPIVTMVPLAAKTHASGNSGAEAGSPVVGEAVAGASMPAPDCDESVERPIVPANEANAITRRCEAEGWIVRIDFWYMSKRAQRFVPVAPVIWPDDRLPGLPPVAWHLLHSRRFEQEYDLLRDAGYVVDVVRWDADGIPPFEICFSVYKPGGKSVIILVTPVDYPATMPAVRIAPLVAVEDEEDVFEKLYRASHPLLTPQLPPWDWDSKRTLIELVWHVEKTIAEEGK